MATITKTYPTFDCDAHVTELPAIWDHMSANERGLVKNWFWADGDNLVINGRQIVRGIWASTKGAAAAATEAAGPGVNVKYIRKLRDLNQQGKLTLEQQQYTHHAGARDPHARLRDLDLMGIDQVVVIPISVLRDMPAVENIYAASIVARAYNDWVHDWCSANPERLFAGAVVAPQSAELAAGELRRASKKGFKVGMVHPADPLSNFPNQAKFDPMWWAFEETDMVCAMHTLPGALGPTGPGNQVCPGHFVSSVVDTRRSSTPNRIGFCYEAMLWISNVVLSGFLEKFSKLRMALMEGNALWVPMVLEECDRAYQSNKNLRTKTVRSRPSEIFQERCFVSFEADESAVLRQYAYFENIAIWASDVYHGDGTDAWTTIREVHKHKVPAAVEQKFLGGNARRMYKIEPKMFTTKEPPPPVRPEWYPTMEEIEREYAAVTHVS